MAEEEQGASPKEMPKKGFNLELIYLKDASFETPNSPGIFATEWENPTLNIALSPRHRHISDNTYEVVQTITVTAKLEDTVAYLAEVQQAGIFIMVGMEEDEMQRLLNVNCLNFLYPYARETVTSLINKGGFPNIALAPINFHALYDQKLENDKEKESAAADAAD